MCLWIWPDFLRTLHSATCEDDGVVAHVRGGESFSGQVRDPVTELIVMRCDKVAPLTVKGISNRKCGVAAFTVMREVWGI